MEKKNKPSVLQWIIPFAIPMIIVLIILFNFSVRTNTNAKESVSDDMFRSARRYAKEVVNELETVGRAVNSVCTMLEQDQTLDDEQIVALVRIVADCAEASRAELCNGEGNGVDQLGNKVSVGEEPYFQEIQISDSPFLYIEGEDDAAKRSILVVERVGKDERNFMLLYYPVEKFDSLLCEEDLESGAFLALIDSAGRILSASGSESKMIEGGNLLEAVQGADPEEAQRIRDAMAGNMQGAGSVKTGQESRTLYYAPLGKNQWGIILGVPQSHIDQLVGVQWKNTKGMLISLIVVFLVFCCFILVVDTIGRIRDNKQKKELENKADTDLLTGLNNKLATERKIKNYMAQNPKTQCMMFLLDVDNFKTVNDTMGHAFGDEVLSTLGEEISSIFRASDIIGRVGGDEFMIFLKAVATPEVIRKEARKVEDFFRDFHVGEQVKYAVHASIGVAVFPHEGVDFETLYKAADQGLYKAKRRGKNQLAFYDDKWGEVVEDDSI